MNKLTQETEEQEEIMDELKQIQTKFQQLESAKQAEILEDLKNYMQNVDNDVKELILLTIEALESMM